MLARERKTQAHEATKFSYSNFTNKKSHTRSLLRVALRWKPIILFNLHISSIREMIEQDFGLKGIFVKKGP